MILNLPKVMSMISLYIRSYILCIFILNQLKFHNSYEIISTTTPSRKFISLIKSNRKENKIDNNDINIVLRVMQFNILADGNSGLRDDLSLFNRISKEYLLWNYRKNKLLYEITQYQPDIITLQEVDHYYDFFLPQLSKLGYAGYFAPKPTSACLEVSNNSDGCALFINTNKLKVISCETKTLALSKAELTDSGELQEDEKNIRTQNQVGLIAVCELIQSYYNKTNNYSFITQPPPILIGTTHLKTSKTAVGERYRQRGINQVLGSLNMIYNNLAKNNKIPAVILSGDFNAIPEAITYEPLTYRAVKTHILGLRSVYNEDVAFSGMKMSSKDFYTTWKSRKYDKDEVIVKRCIDYIFYKPFQSKTIRETNEFNQTTTSNVIAFSSKQVAISSLLRFTVYFFGALIPLTSLISEQLTFKERLFILFISILSLLSFELSAEGSIFRPQLSKTIKNIELLEDRPEAFKPIPEFEKTFLKSVVSLSQKLQPLPQYGNPGFEAIAALDILSDEEIGPSYIPSKDYPSDHLSIVADLQLKW